MISRISLNYRPGSGRKTHETNFDRTIVLDILILYKMIAKSKAGRLTLGYGV